MSKLNQPESKTMGFLYACYGFSKETIEELYTEYSEEVYLNLTLNVGNTILDWLNVMYENYLIYDRGVTITLNNYESYYVADRTYTMGVKL